MYENITARLAADEAVSLGIVKPFHCSLFHCDTCFYFEFLLRRIAADERVDRYCGTNSQTAVESNLADINLDVRSWGRIHSKTKPEDALAVGLRRQRREWQPRPR